MRGRVALDGVGCPELVLYDYESTLRRHKFIDVPASFGYAHTSISVEKDHELGPSI